MDFQQTIKDKATIALADAKRVSDFSAEMQEAMGLDPIYIEHMALLNISFYIEHLHVEIYASSVSSIETPGHLLLAKRDPTGDKYLWEYSPVLGVPYDYIPCLDLMSKIMGNLKAGRAELV